VFALNNFSYTITVTNLGPTSASNIIVSDTLPTNVVFVSASSGGTATNGIVTWPAMAKFTNSATTNFTLTVTAPANGSLTNKVSSGATTYDAVSSNNDGSSANAIVTTTITPQADIQTSNTGPTNVFAGTNFSYTITLTNLGPSTASS